MPYILKLIKLNIFYNFDVHLSLVYLILGVLGFWGFGVLAVFWCNHFATHHIHPTRVPSLVLTLSADFGSKLSVILSHFPKMSDHLTESEQTEMRQLIKRLQELEVKSTTSITSESHSNKARRLTD